MGYKDPLRLRLARLNDRFFSRRSKAVAALGWTLNCQVAVRCLFWACGKLGRLYRDCSHWASGIMEAAQHFGCDVRHS